MHNSKQRDLSVDIVKGLAIICMVGGHCAWPFTKFIYLFHMAVFLIASGYCYKESYSCEYMGIVRFAKRKISTLWFPYVLWMVIFSVLHNFFIRINVYTDNPLIFQYVCGSFITTTNYWTLTDVIENIIKAMLLHGHAQVGGHSGF